MVASDSRIFPLVVLVGSRRACAGGVFTSCSSWRLCSCLFADLASNCFRPGSVSCVFPGGLSSVSSVRIVLARGLVLLHSVPVAARVVRVLAFLGVSGIVYRVMVYVSDSWSDVRISWLCGVHIV